MIRWTKEIAEEKVKNLISAGGKNGGLLISDNHGEIPLQVPEDVLLEISESVMKWGKYPLDWVGD
jgi:uroporphyrinogen decarboxylase